MRRFFVTGDKHRNFKDVIRFCRKEKTNKEDVLIILGDSGFNYFGDERDSKLKRKISKLKITVFCLHGNKENRPQNVGTYGIRNFCDGKVYYEPKYPNLYFAIDGQVYTFAGKQYMVIGGAHSVDKMRCIEEGLPFFEDEMPDDKVKELVENKLQIYNNQIEGFMTHTCPLRYVPTEMFVSTRQKEMQRKKIQWKKKKLFVPDIDRSTEKWLEILENTVAYDVWYCGHYHIDKQIDKINMMYHEIVELL